MRISWKKVVFTPLLFFSSTLFAQCQEDTSSQPLDTGKEEVEQDPGTPGKEIPKFVHSTYMVGARIQGQQEIDQSNYGKFSFIYLSAAPTWEVSDFDKEEVSIMDKYVNDFSYPSGDKGLALVPKMIEKSHLMGAKVLLSFGGGEPFLQITGNEQRRVKFAKMMAQFIKKFNYDGIDLDWEASLNVELHTLFMAAIRTELNAMEKMMERSLYQTTALAEAQRYTPKQAEALSAQVDWINVMTYDMGGGTWGATPKHNTPLNTIKTRIQNNFGSFSPSKLCIGLANYGYSYTDLVPGVEVGREVVSRQSKSCSYNIPELLEKGWTEEWDDTAKASYYFSPDHTDFVTMDNTRSLHAKIEWIVQNKFLGEFWWVYDCDYTAAKTGEPYSTNVLIDTVEKRYKELIK